MKKILLVILIFFHVLSVIFAEGLFSASVDMSRDILFLRSFTGDYAKKGNSQALYQYQGETNLQSFQTSEFKDGLIAFVRLHYANDHFGGLIAIRALAAEYSEIRLNDWEAWVKTSPWFNVLSLRILGGNQAIRGQIKQYTNFNEYLPYRVDPMGIMLPVKYKLPLSDPFLGNTLVDYEFPYGYGSFGMPTGYAEFIASDTNDLFMLAGETTRKTGFMIDISAAPIIFSASVAGLYADLYKPFNTPWNSELKPDLPRHDSRNDPLNNKNINYGFRAESININGFLSLAATYKYAELNKTKIAQDAQRDIDFTVKSHAFGAYANIQTPDDIWLTIGYSGLYRSSYNSIYNTLTIPDKEKDIYWPAEYKNVLFPFYNGLDLRLYYTGINRLFITFNNNFSFASVSGTDKKSIRKEYADTWMYDSQLNESNPKALNRSEKYFGIGNIIGFQYSINNSILADFSLSSQLGIFILDWERDALKTTVHHLGVYTGCRFIIMERAGVQASINTGLALKLSSYKHMDSESAAFDSKYITSKAGYIDFGIPLGVKVEY